MSYQFYQHKSERERIKAAIWISSHILTNDLDIEIGSQLLSILYLYDYTLLPWDIIKYSSRLVDEKRILVNATEKDQRVVAFARKTIPEIEEKILVLVRESIGDLWKRV